MPPAPSLEDRIATAGIARGRRHDVSYRTGLVLQVLGAGILAVLYPMNSPFYTAGIMLFELGALLSGISLLVRRTWIKKLLLGSILAGLPLQVLGMVYAPPELAGTVILAGIGLVCIGAAGMAGKEAYCFAYREGWIIMWLFPVIIVANLLGKENSIYNSLAFSSLFLLLLSLAGKKLKQPLQAKCAAGICAAPEK